MHQQQKRYCSLGNRIHKFTDVVLATWQSWHRFLTLKEEYVCVNAETVVLHTVKLQRALNRIKYCFCYFSDSKVSWVLNSLRLLMKQINSGPDPKLTEVNRTTPSSFIGIYLKDRFLKVFKHTGWIQMCRHLWFAALQTSLWCHKPHVLHIKPCTVLLICSDGAKFATRRVRNSTILQQST